MVTILYKCRCMAAEVAVKVPARREDEGVVDWVQQPVGFSLYLDHRARSPKCQKTTMEYVKIPAPENAPYLGGTPKVN